MFVFTDWSTNAMAVFSTEEKADEFTKEWERFCTEKGWVNDFYTVDKVLPTDTEFKNWIKWYVEEEEE